MAQSFSNVWQGGVKPKSFFSSFPVFNVQLSHKAQPLNQWFSTYGPWPTGGSQKYFAVSHRAVWFEKVVFTQWAIYWFESLQKVAVNGELTVFFFGGYLFSAGKTVWVLVKTFFLEITWFWQKNRINLIQDWWKFGSSSFTVISSFFIILSALRNRRMSAVIFKRNHLTVFKRRH